MKMLMVIDNEVIEVTHVKDSGYGKKIDCDNGCEYYIFEDSEAAGQAAREYWQDMKDNDKSEFRCIIGDERLVEWACGESDSFGISSFDEFLDIVETVPEEQWAGYDGCEIEVDSMNNNLKNELGYCDKTAVIYRWN